MRLTRVGLIAVAALAAVAAVATAGCGSSPATSTSTDGAGAPKAQLEAAVTGFTELLEPVRPAKFYGKQLTPVRCVSYMKGRDAELEQVAAGAAFAQERSSWSTLAGLIREEQEFARAYGEGAVPTACHGEIGYWQVLSGGGDEYVVRAAVLVTMDTGRWDAARHELVDTGSVAYDEAAATDYTMRRVDGVWKVVATHGTGLSFTRGGSGLHPDSA